MNTRSCRLVCGALLSLGALASMTGCGPLISRSPSPALHDLGGARARLPDVPALRGIDVRAPSWLDSSAMHYRLGYESATRRDVYAYSRWAASPPELLSVALRQMLASGDVDRSGQSGCLLRVDIEELIHHYDEPARARALLAGRAALTDPRGQRVLARLSFSLSEPASRADAAGGVAATIRAIDVLGTRIADWLAAPGTGDDC
jgi:cholesterol transport system auxiliary component